MSAVRYTSTMEDDRRDRAATAPTWDERTLAQMPSSLDVSQIVENLALSPTERILKMLRFLRLAEAMQRGTARGLRSDPDRA